MSVSLEQLAHILAKIRVSSSLEEEILTAAESLNTPSETNEESASEDSCIFDDKQSFEQEIDEDDKELQHDLSEGKCAYESHIERWFQVSTQLDQFNFSFYLVSLSLQQEDSFIILNFHLSFEKLPLNILLLLLREWLHWKSDYT